MQQFETFKMKEDEDIEVMLCKFQLLVSGMQVLDKSYSTKYHVTKILRSLQVKWRPKVTTIKEAKDLNKLGLYSLISNLMSHELTLNHDGAKPKSKSIVLKSEGKMVKALQAQDEAPEEADEDVGSLMMMN